MIKIKNRINIWKLCCAIFAITIGFSYFSSVVYASQIGDRKVIIGSSVANANTTYSFLFTMPTNTIVRSASFVACTEASGTCNTPAGFSSSSATLPIQPINLGDASGWLVDNSLPGSLRITNSSNSTASSGSQTVNFANVINPSAENSTYYIRINLYSADNFTGLIDSGVVATSTAGQVTVSVVIGEKLSFVLNSTNVSLSEPTTSSTGVGSSSMTVSTNAKSGYSVSYSGNTLRSGANEITPMTTASSSIVNTKQFGINLMSNTSPSVGASVAGVGLGVVANGYNTQNQFKFNPLGETIANASGPTNDNTFTTSYIANMDGSTAAGVYSTLINYVATANF